MIFLVSVLILFIICSICNITFSFKRSISSLTTRTQHCMICMSIQSRNELQDKLTIWNSASRQKQLFRAINPPKVSFYSCGPTLYDYSHIGNFRAFLTYDLLKRWLEYCGYDVTHVCNLTDIDDKIIAKMIKDGLTHQQLTCKFEKAFYEDIEALNIKRANFYPRATDHIKDIERMIEKLVKTNHAYSQRGSVYYRVSSFKNYGVLAKATLNRGNSTSEGRGVDDKESAQDFALWKAYDPKDQSIGWDSLFGRGRPGWHIECSAMCHKLLGNTIDIHAGGIDLLFPHHQNEIAQSEAFTGQQFARYWVHNGFVNLNNVKMSKSLNNFKTLREISSSALGIRAFRYLIISSHYRTDLNFSPESMTSAVNSLMRIDRVISYLKIMSLSESPIEDNKDVNSLIGTINSYKEEFENSMCDDLNTPKALSFLFAIIGSVEREINVNGKLPASLAHHILSELLDIDRVLGLIYDVPASYLQESNSDSKFGHFQAEVLLDSRQVPEDVMSLAQRRSESKAAKNFKEADELRSIILSHGYSLKDRKDGGFDIYRILKN